MKIKTNSSIVVVGFILASISSIVANAQTNQGALSYLVESKPEVPKTSAEKLDALKKRYDDSFAEFSLYLNRLSTETDLLGSKELFAQIDKTDREMKSLRTSCGSFMTSLRTSAKNIQDNKSFTDEQKTELITAAESLAENCTVITNQADLASTQLSKAYATASKWKTIHKTYLDLQGESKAAEQVKTHISEYLKSFAEGAKEAANNNDQEQKPSE